MQGEELYIAYIYIYIVITGSTDEFLAIKFNLINKFALRCCIFSFCLYYLFYYDFIMILL